MVNYKSFSINEAAKLIGISVDELIELGIQKKIRMGVYARGWWGVWEPDFNDDSKHGMCLSDIDENGRETYCRRAANGELVCLKEVFIAQYWHVHHSSLYRLLTGHSREPMDIYIFEAVNINNMVDALPDCYTKRGCFKVHKTRNFRQQKHGDENPSTLISVDDLRILQEEIERIKLSLKPVKRLVSNKGGDIAQIVSVGSFITNKPKANKEQYDEFYTCADEYIEGMEGEKRNPTKLELRNYYFEIFKGKLLDKKGFNRMFDKRTTKAE